MEKDNYVASTEARGSFPGGINYGSPDSEQDPVYNGSSGGIHEGGVANDSVLNNTYDQHQQSQQSRQQLLEPNNNSMNGFLMPMPSSAVDRSLSFADVMQFADFGPKLTLHHPYSREDQHNEQLQDAVFGSIINRDGQPTGAGGMDHVNSLLKFPVLSNQLVATPGQEDSSLNNTINNECSGGRGALDEIRGIEFRYEYPDEQQDVAVANNQLKAGTNDNVATAYNNDNPVQLDFLSGPSSHDDGNNATDENFVGLAAVDGINKGGSSKRKRPRTIKTTEEVESQRMTHIAVERNRRKQMNEHLRVLRSLMPSSYVQRGDQASIIGGAIEFVRELEQLLQCLESQKRRRLYGDQAVRPIQLQGESSSSPAHAAVQPTNYSNTDQLDPSSCGAAEGSGLLLREETAESKSCIADVEVKVLGFDALIKVLSRRRPSQLIRAIAALEEELQFTILHTNITTIEHTVLYSFNVKVATEAPRFTAEDIANSVQQIFTFIHTNAQII